ncbi:S8/S53 family peptidase [Streptomyces sp. SID13031]|uniref:S8/S53 family peptidase n=1 Tax=Streptomyces sp. SID13031 TaxID=2706046 RepID=UPI0013C9B3CC|nr:S8/S53 family peptidase [Streptomyces sp. SID13031]NEA30703.1 S8/S53 family peptidase [Streptomyces sp. SID13031]
MQQDDSGAPGDGGAVNRPAESSAQDTGKRRGRRTPVTAEQAQRELILKHYGPGTGNKLKVHQGRTVGSDCEVDFLFEAGTILVREEHYEQVRGILSDLEILYGDGDEQPESEPVLAGVRLVRLKLNNSPHLDTLETLRIIREGGSVRINLPGGGDRDVPVTAAGAGACAPNTVLVVAGNGAGCPAEEPEPMPAGSAPYPGYTADRAAGAGVRVVVVDTGLDRKAAKRNSWLAGVTGDRDKDVKGGNLRGYAGHGTFIAGVIRCVAPLAEVHVRRGFGTGGVVTEAELVKTLDQILEHDYPDIISMSAGTYCYDATRLLTFTVFNERRLQHHKGVVMVVAAGNESGREPFWPAAAPFTVSVGALGAHWRGRAGFSNHGGWVDVYAPGQDLVNSFPKGRYKYRQPPHVGKGRVEDFHGMARWSGTSFSTPIVVGLIAARMSRTGENGRDAAAALIAEAQRAAQPGVGAVLLPE